MARSQNGGPTSVSQEVCRPLMPEPAEWPHLDATTSQSSASDKKKKKFREGLEQLEGDKIFIPLRKMFIFGLLG